MSKVNVALGTLAVLAVIFVLIAEGFLIVELVRRLQKENQETHQGSKEFSEADVTTVQITLQDDEKAWTSRRLPSNLIPIKYNVSLRPIMEKDANGDYFLWGSSSVAFICNKSTKHIIMHQSKINFTHTNISLQLEGEAVKIVKIENFDANHLIMLETESECTERQIYHLHFDSFVSNMSSRNDFGLYVSENKEDNGNLRRVASSQMQPTGARSIFPCFDEPAMKANFTFTLWYKSGSDVIALSNMPPKITGSGIPIDGELWNYTIFEETHPISTYILAVIIGKFSGKTVQSRSGVQMTTYSREKAIQNGEADYAVDIAKKILDFYETYFGLTYPLPKLDQIAVERLAFGAMENWGLITYKASVLLLNKKSSLKEKFVTTRVVSHELVHQWFGNLVTLEWWNELWLNEGFATYFSHVGESIVQPEWKTLGRFLLKEYYPAMEKDQTTSTHPILQNVSTPTEIWNLFDVISYKKGASILRMIQGFLGEDTFMSGLRAYLKDLKYGVTNSEILVKYWEQHWSTSQTNSSLKDVVLGWLLQPGFPMVSVIRDRRLNSSYQIAQERFSPYFKSRNLTSSQWYIPLTYKTISGNETKLSWSKRNQTLTIRETDTIIVNVEVRGFYRVNYDGETWNEIIQHLKRNTLHDIPRENRGQLISDCFAMAKSGRLDAVTALELSEYLIRETEYFPWERFLKEIRYYEDMLSWTKAEEYLSRFINRLIEPIYNKYGWNEKSDDIYRLFGDLVVSYACRYGNEDCVKKAVEKYSNWMNVGGNDSNIYSSYRTTVYCMAIQHGGLREWNFAMEQLGNEQEPEEINRLVYGMSCQTNPWILKQFIKDNIARVIHYVSNQKLASSISWSRIIEYQLHDPNQKLVTGWVLSQIAKRFSTRGEVNLVTAASAKGIAFYELFDLYATIWSNIAWKTANEDELNTWLLQKL